VKWALFFIKRVKFVQMIVGMAQALDKQINSYLPLLGTEEKESLLSVIKSFLSLKHADSAKRTSIEQYNEEQNAAVARVKNGESYTQEEAEQQAAKW
jgi:ERCC4-type nuclease